MIRAGVKGVKEIFVVIRHCRYAIEKILTRANMIVTDIDK